MTNDVTPAQNAIMPFEFDGSDVRVLWRDEAPWFVAKDVAEVLGYKNPRDAISKHCKSAISGGVAIRDSTGRRQNTAIIPERDLYRLIMRSKLPAAERFEEWVVGEVLPSIRKTGTYGSAPALPDFTDPAIAARAWAEQYEQRITLEQEKTVMLPKAEFCDRVTRADGAHTIREAAKILRTGEKRLFAWLREQRFLMHNNQP